MRQVAAPTDGSTDRVLYLYPAINLADLIKGDVAMHFISSHATTEPCRLVWNVLEYTSVDIAEYRQQDHNLSHMMSFRKCDALGYGKLVDTGAADHVHDMHPRLGLLALEIQKHIYSFLLDLSNEILRIDFDKLTIHGPFNKTIFRLQNEWPSLSVLSTSASYRAATSTNLDDITTMVETEVQEKIYYLAEMRESPRCFLDLIRQRKRTLRQPAQQNKTDTNLNGRAIYSLIYEAYADLFFWSYAQDSLRQIQSCKKSGTMYKQSGALTDHCMTLFQLLDGWTVQSIMNAIPSLAESVEIQLGPRGSSTAELYRFQETSAKIKQTDSVKQNLYDLLDNLADETARDMRGMATIVADIQDIIDEHHVVRTRLDRFTLRLFEQIVLATELRRQIRLLGPLARLRRCTDVEQSAIDEYQQITVRYDDVERLLHSYLSRCNIHPDDRHFEYRPNPINEGSKARRTQVPKLFDDLWVGLDKTLGHTPRDSPKGKGISQSHERVFVEVQFHAHWLRKEPEYQHVQDDTDDEEETEGTDTPISPLTPTSPIDHAFQTLNIGGTSMTSDAPRTVPRVRSIKEKKKKTRGTANPPEITGPQAPNEEQNNQHTKIKVSQAAYETLQLAFQTEKGSPPGEVKWTRVLQMMRAIGFTPRGPRDIKYSFIHEDPSVRTFPQHAPHGLAWMPIQEFEKFVRRLKFVYSWFKMDSFELEE